MPGRRWTGLLQVEGKTYYPFGVGSGDRIVRDFGLPNLIRLPIVPDLSAAGDSGRQAGSGSGRGVGPC